MDNIAIIVIHVVTQPNRIVQMVARALVVRTVADLKRWQILGVTIYVVCNLQRKLHVV